MYFTHNELRNSYKDCGVERGRTIYITGNLGRLGFIKSSNGVDKNKTIDTHISVLLDLVGDTGNIAFPTHTTELVGTKDIFDPLESPTKFTFSEALRQRLDHSRQVHPFLSTAVYGPDAKDLVPGEIIPHSFGPNTPMDKLVEADALHVSIGAPLRTNLSEVHHCELLAGVPYRYVKSFLQPCKLYGQTAERNFFMYVWYRQSDIVRDGNRKIMDLPEIKKISIIQSLGRSSVSSIPIQPFVRTLVHEMQKDPYIWLENYPNLRPWEQ